MKKALLFVLVGLVMTAAAAWADVPLCMNFQGRLTDNTGDPLPDGTRAVTVGLYTQESGGNAIWNDVFSTPTKNGYFNIVLGKDGTVGKTLAGVNFNQQLYVGIRVETDTEMTPRQPLSSVPHALSVPDGAITQKKAPRAVFANQDNAKIEYGGIEIRFNDGFDSYSRCLRREFTFAQARGATPRIVGSFSNSGGFKDSAGNWISINYMIASALSNSQGRIIVTLSGSGTPASGSIWVDYIVIGQ